MEEEGGVKAPVTRLRRRLSVEQSDEIKSSSAPNTPTKKRGGRRVAKPELDLIDENAPENNISKRSTKKTVVKDLESAEEKPVTPSRRSTRIKSNTSIVSETAQTVDSPRAKRAARRVSQVGSDNEAPLTPARQTRRTRKDSASNVDKAETQASSKPASIAEIIVEESELNIKKPGNDSDKPVKQTSPLRKSPRLSLKNNVPRLSIETGQGDKDINTSKDLNTSNKENEKIIPQETVKDVASNVDGINNGIKVSEVVVTGLSKSSTELIKQVNNIPTKKTLSLNKSSSSIENMQSVKKKRHRTKSWTNPTNPIINDTKCYSDTESFKKKNESLLHTPTKDDLVNLAKNDKPNVSMKNNRKSLQNNTVVKNEDEEINSINVKKSPKAKSKNTSASDNLNTSALLNKKRESMKSNLSTDIYDGVNESLKQIEKQELLSPSEQNKINTDDANLFNKEPNKNMQVTVYIEESDSNSDKPNKQIDDEDQCVPVVKSRFVTQETTLPKETIQTSFNFGKENKNIIENKNDSCEPMDIDETIPDNIMQSESQMKVLDKSEQKSLIKHADDADSNSNQKSPLFFSMSQTNDKIEIESKSTLILSDLKDISSNENDALHSLQVPTEKNVSKSDCALDVSKNKEQNNSSLKYLTSTPLQKNKLKLKNIGLQVNTSAIEITNYASKVEKTPKNLSKTNLSKKSNCSNKSSDSSVESDLENSEAENNFINNEAEEASDDYESGDSKDEDEEQYERENEIVQKGETLTSDDDSLISNDTDYEKDSFIVHSDEDNELLDGTGDDLSMSDNELKMTAKSKKKYNERKLKQQKNASREMFESRHKLNISSKSGKVADKVKNKRNVFESSDSEDDDVGVKLKKKNNMRRLDSSHETSINKSTENNTEIENDKSRNATHNESLINEVEMTVFEDIVKETDPLSTTIKKEPKTPQTDNYSMQFIDSNNLKENDGDKNKSHVDMQADLLEESNGSDYSDSSDNEHIQNYDSILNELNKSNKTKKTKIGSDVSLNLDKKTKIEKVTSIVEELNLTQTKSKKNKKKPHGDEIDFGTNTEKPHKVKNKLTPSIKQSDHEASSDSIDLHLLFSEESNSSEEMRTSTDNIQSSKAINDEKDFIPLKKSNGKTNIPDCSTMNNSYNHDTVPNESAKKINKKRKTLEKSRDDNEVPDEETNVQLFIDTTGDLESAAANNSFNVSVSKKKIGNLEEKDDDENSDAPLEVSNKSVTEKLFPYKDINSSVSLEKSNDKSMNKTPKSEKKKKKKILENQTVEETNKILTESPVEGTSQEDIAQDHIEDQALEADPIDKSMAKTPKSEKKKKKRLSESQIVEDIAHEITNNEECHNKSTNSSKKQRNSIGDDQIIADEIVIKSSNKSLIMTPSTEKKKKSKLSESIAVDSIDEVVNNSSNKSFTVTPSTEKKKKSKLSEFIVVDSIDKVVNKSLTMTPGTEKKKNISGPTILDSTENVTEGTGEALNSKKRKRKSSVQKDQVVDGGATINKSEALNVSVTSNSRKKKRKISHNAEDFENENQDDKINTEVTVMENYKSCDIDKKKTKQSLQNETNIPSDIIPTDMTKKKTNNKRKEREDDDGTKTSKVLKVDTFDKLHVPRLPKAIINQLEEKPKKKNLEVARSKAIATSDFVVEETKKKKNKPSNYLEESVYINEDDPAESKKQKDFIKKPKVLPFLPTASTSSSGYTTNFKVNILPREIQFVAKASDVCNYKNDYLQNKKIKRLGTYQLYKRNRNIKMSKF